MLSTPITTRSRTRLTGAGRRTKVVIAAIIGTFVLMMSGIPAIIAIILSIIYGLVVRSRDDGAEDTRATNYPPCPGCGSHVWVPKSRAEVVWRFTDLWVRQYFDCADCNIRCRLVRMSDSEYWTFSRTYYV